MPLVALLVLAAQVAGGPPAGLTRQGPGEPTPATTTPVIGVISRGRPLPLCSGIQVVAPNLEVQPRDLGFSSRQVLDLQFRARLRRDLQGDHTLQLKVFTPGGFLYQVITVPFVGALPPPDPREMAARAKSGAAARPAGPPPPRMVEGYPRPLPVQRLVPVAGDQTARTQYQVIATLPVAGTSITMSSLYGRWRVEPHLDGQPGPCGPAARFTIRD
jgi:hypothetical protein